MENDALFTNIQERRNTGNRKTQHLHNLAAQANSKSLITTVIARTKVLSFEQLTNSHCEQDSKEILRAPKTSPSNPTAELRSTAQNIKVTRHKTRQSTTSRDKHTDKNDREASWEKDGSSSATYHRKEKAADCNRYKTTISTADKSFTISAFIGI
ncbi:hypothetical protein AVEN_160890-1 [Araneus ventricosus]|uniref:Uncharacterized protein n=1 Tax=Araneus ventricosus TaxID=182803 RepID=A0A4Y2KU70_ARAVE|nr:hypothetical protein AVEN_160890-1 [Araneus ventricosus]